MARFWLLSEIYQAGLNENPFNLLTGKLTAFNAKKTSPALRPGIFHEAYFVTCGSSSKQ